MTNANTLYAQYRAILESDDTSELCIYGGVAAPCSPEVTSTSFFRANYDTSASPVTNSNTLPYYQSQSFAQALGNAGCASPPGFTLSPDGLNF